MKLKGFAFIILSLTSVLGCRGNSDYVYYLNDRPQTVEQSFKVKEIIGNNLLDILFVIDNSASMDMHQRNVIKNTSDFIETLSAGSKLQWKLGLVSTSTYETPFLGMTPTSEVDFNDPLAVDKFKSAVSQLGLGGDPRETVTEAVLVNLSRYPKFLRSRANLAIIAITDAAPQYSNGTSTVQSFEKELISIKGKSSMIGFYGAFGPENWCQTTDWPSFTWSGSDYEKLVTVFKGMAFPICSKDFGIGLLQVAQSIVSSFAQPKIYLAVRPRLNTLEVSFHGNRLPAGSVEEGGVWYYDPSLNAIVFHSLEFAQGDTEYVDVAFKEDNGNPY
ncbi:MAG: VWA domain-containing protein [Oligoflexia bacterium]|nr:VWA domain-containing protein [Oligoflexia bacterium]